VCRVTVTIRSNDPVVAKFLTGLESGSKGAVMESILAVFLRMGQVTSITSLQRAVLAAEPKANKIVGLWPDEERKDHVWAGLCTGERFCLSPMGEIEEVKGW